ncbi:MAG: TrmH family RNA methyltransferase [Saprospiraceae bacterium]
MSRKQLNFRETRPDFAAYLHHIQNNRHPISLLLDQVRDIRNIGAIFRLADAARIAKIYFYKMEDVQLNINFRRVARSTEQFIIYESLHTLEQVNELAQTHQFVALEWTNDSVPYHEIMIREPILLALGNEETGVSDEILQMVETCIHIPMYGIKNSMNVAMATGIAVYDLLSKLMKE